MWQTFDVQPLYYVSFMIYHVSGQSHFSALHLLCEKEQKPVGKQILWKSIYILQEQ